MGDRARTAYCQYLKRTLEKHDQSPEDVYLDADQPA